MLTLFFYILIIVLIVISSFTIVNATHLSKPVIDMNKTVFNVDEPIIIKGWVSYFDLPTPDVLLDISLKAPDGSQVARSFLKSDLNGNFSTTFLLNKNSMPGRYTAKVISDCKDEHRAICENKGSSIMLDIINRSYKIDSIIH